MTPPLYHAGSPLLQMHGIRKTFGSVTVLQDVSLDCHAGQVHAICGENGAGKSTLMKVLGGIYKPDSGEIRIDGRPVHFSAPGHANAAGVAIIHQELALLPHRTVAENIFLGHEPTRWGLVDRRAMVGGARIALERMGCSIDPSVECGRLSVAEQQMVEIAKAVSLNARILVLDEPTAALDDVESRKLFALIADLRRQGVAMLYISHRMAEIMALADQVSVIKDGQRMATLSAREASVDRIVALMVGRELSDFYPPPAAQAPGREIYAIEGGTNEVLRDIHLRLRAGEIVGVAGLEASGKIDLARTVFGERRWTFGTVRTWDGRGAARSPRDATRRGIGYLPDDRKREGLGLRQSLRDNAALTLRALASPLANAQRGTRSTRRIDALLQQVQVRAANLNMPVGELSGGNQQKVMLARWLARAPRLWVVCEPTRGVDVGAKATIYQLLRDFADCGGAVLVVSSDLVELIGLCDRLCVMAQARIVAHLPRGTSEEAIMEQAVRHDLDGPIVGVQP
uniref:sugar ABC transporter ATP-binding protein n=1 Tax=uncultured Acidovorax sp. TaxID=158751 RepID=UPI00076ADE55|nr:sugar ABC transporter ATP-binding protein [uncultured Acidovorax sp.]